MKKALNTIVLTFFFFSSFAQTPSEEIDPIQKFIEATVQIPFMAQVDNVQGQVEILISMDDNNLPVKYEIVKGLRFDCDAEALRVAKLINVRNLEAKLKNGNKVSLSIPFFTIEKVIYDEGTVFMLFDSEKKRTFDESNFKYSASYFVDLLTGIINSGITYHVLQETNAKYVDYATLSIDTTERSTLSICENEADDMKVYTKSALNNSNFPLFFISWFENGQLRDREANNKTYYYYPNGRIRKLIEKDTTKSIEKEITFTKEFEWHANGQLFAVIERKVSKELNEEKYISVWDTLGNQVVKNGNGICSLYLYKLKDAIKVDGQIKEGLKEGQWIGKTMDNKTAYIEYYEKNNLVKGIAYIEKDSVVYETIEEMADFKGGLKKFADFLQKNLNYPKQARQESIEGKVYVQFTVCTDGTLCDYKVVKGIGGGCDEESVRVLHKSSGKWIAGKQRGKAVRSRFTIPISYKLTGSR
ncbi:energy transducer TonB [Arcicella sp. DC2W]|uniref:Energy transducer TonB n=1 Tax=Arcicella gelida TaxID=2984195 RepID=A0ABU5S8C2_9BACT|nr:energy transducer TonB [Arcicella sp. DC2W]MEA5404606.1 energy transducer TonB [Arcicella sp. DC2W]